MAETVFAGIDIGGTKCAITIGPDPQTVVKKKIIPTNHDVPVDVFIEHLMEETEKLIASIGGDGTPSIQRIGVVCGGPLDLKRGRICSPPNLPGWDDVEIVRILESRFNVHVLLQNDADASAVAEWSFGAGVGCATMVFLTFGTGMGAGLIINGELYRGASNSAGEVGRIRLSEPNMREGCDGTFEGYCSGNGIARRARALARIQFETTGAGPLYCPTLEGIADVSARTVADAARAADPFAVEIFEETAERLGSALATILDILNPSRIVIGGVYARCQDLLEKTTLATMKDLSDAHAYNACSVVSCGLGETVGDVAALSVATGLLQIDEEAVS